MRKVRNDSSLQRVNRAPEMKLAKAMVNKFPSIIFGKEEKPMV